MMIRSVISRGALLGLLVPVNACGSPPTTAPTTVTPDVSVSAPAPPGRTSPPLVGPSRTFVFDHPLEYPVRSYTEQSRIVLYDNGAFALQYPAPIGEYHGGYAQSGDTINFEWEGGSVAGAFGTIADTSLTMHYNETMQLSDFENAVYRLSPNTPTSGPADREKR